MAYYAFLDKNNIVTEVIPGRDEYEVVDGVSDWEEHYGQIRNQVCKQTSYNTRGGKNIREGGIPFRKNYAGIGMTYDETRDAFIPPSPYPSWVLDENTCLWEAPTPRPEGNETTGWKWNEETVSWESFTKPIA
jgi:hypothetical protein